MATKKLSEIALAASQPALSDTVVGVGSGTTDLQYTLSQIKSSVGARTRLTASTIYYVSTTGSDSNDGLTPATAWATLQHAVDFVANTVDLGGFNLTVQLLTGTYSGAIQNGVPDGSGYLIVQGDTVTVSNTVVQDSNGSCFVMNWPVKNIVFESVYFKTTGGAFDLIEADAPVLAYFNNCAFDATAGGLSYGLAAFNAFADFEIGFNPVTLSRKGMTVTGSYVSFCFVSDGNAHFELISAWTFSGTPSWSTAWVQAGNDSFIFLHPTFSATGAVSGTDLSIIDSSAFQGVPGHMPGGGTILADPSSSINGSIWPTTVSALNTNFPAASYQGSRMFVTNSNATIVAGLGNTVAGGGANKVPVYSDGANWIIG